MTTNSFLSRYLHYAGTSHAPRAFHLWSGLMALSATVMDRVWVESAGERLPPNLYVFLIGESGAGKGVATSTMMRLLNASATVRTYSGMLTAQHLCDMLDVKRRQQPKILIVTEELSLSVGDRALADRLIRLATALYMCSPYEFNEGTRTHGTVKFKDQCVCWHAGSTQTWMRESIPRSAVEGGFFARVNCVVDTTQEPRRPMRPQPNLLHFQSLVDDLITLRRTVGPLTLTSEAEDTYWNWAESRPLPTDAALKPVWMRVPIHVLKIATLLSLGDGLSMTIERDHITEARQLAEECLRHLPSLMEYVAMNQDTDGVRYVKDAIRSAERVNHNVLVRWMMRHGMNAQKVKEHIATLEQGGFVHTDTVHGKPVYAWRGNVLPGEDESSETR